MGDKTQIATLVSSIAVPVILAAATLLFQITESNNNRDTRCTDYEFKLYEEGCRGGECKLTGDKLLIIDSFRGYFKDHCPATYTERAANWINETSIRSNDAGIYAAALLDTNKTLPKITKVPGSAESVATLISSNLSVGPGVRFRNPTAGFNIFVQFRNAESVAANRDFFDYFNASTYRGQRISATPLVGNERATGVILRCFNSEDCSVAPPLAAYASQYLAREVIVQDMSDGYGKEATLIGQFQLLLPDDFATSSVAIAKPKSRTVHSLLPPESEASAPSSDQSHPSKMVLRRGGVMVIPNCDGDVVRYVEGAVVFDSGGVTSRYLLEPTKSDHLVVIEGCDSGNFFLSVDNVDIVVKRTKLSTVLERAGLFTAPNTAQSR